MRPPSFVSEPRPERDRAAEKVTEARPPVRFDDIVDEIAYCTGLPCETVAARVWMEALQGGWNVARDVERFHATPHRYDERLERVYREGDGFIFETMVYWAHPLRQRWIARAADRLEAHAAHLGREPRILMLGDGSGNDSLYLVGRGFTVDYFDHPGSRTFEFARRRFTAARLLDDRIRIPASYGAIRRGAYDAVLSFEVLEHLPDPLGAMRDIAAFLRPGGIALITEAFKRVSAIVPTHLAANRRLAGRTPFLFLRHGLALTWYATLPLFKPYEFTANGRPGLRARLRLVTDAHVMRTWIEGRYRRLTDPLSAAFRRLWRARPRAE